jgi:hypothetical protein
MTQVEDGLRVSFQPVDHADQPGRSFVPVGWFWRDGPTPAATCTRRCVKEGTEHARAHDDSKDGSQDYTRASINPSARGRALGCAAITEKEVE